MSSAATVTDPSLPFDAAWRQEAGVDLEPEGLTLLERVADWAAARFNDSRAMNGEPLAHHAAGAARILANLRTDSVTRSAAVLAALPADLAAPIPALHKDPIAQEFGVEVGRLVQGARALVRLGGVARQARDSQADTGSQKEMQRKMLLAMATDLRIVLMRMASRLQTLRWHGESKTPCPASFARETLDLYAPLANRLGIWQVKWEIEDLAFRFLEPERYKQIAHLLEEKRVEREAFIASTLETLHTTLTKAGIEAEVSGRPKHIYSIWNKMRLKGVDFSHLYDLRALRIIVSDVRACYAALALVHELWSPLSEEFDDYISRPKPNGYRSLHTVVSDLQGRPFEVQIRTREMHQFAEYGMAAHWRYKEAGAKGGQVAASSDYDRQLAWMRQLLAWNSEVELRETSPRCADDRIYVLTPQARVIELPVGATPIDFAYHLHTDLGHRCRGARVDGHIVPLQTRLATGQTVEIITAKTGGPSRDWLNVQLGFLISQRARIKVRAWFNAIELQQRIHQGQTLVEKELQRLGKTAVNLEQLAQSLGFARADDLYVAVAKEELSLRQIAGLFQHAAPVPVTAETAGITHASRPESTEKGGQSGVLVVGVGSLLTQLARCCRPAPPDFISGFVTRGRGVSIHRATCPNFKAMVAREPERMIEVAWGDIGETFYPVDISVRAHDRSGLLRDLSEVFARLRLNVIGVNTQSRHSLAHMVFTVEVRGGESLGRVLDALREVAGVFAAVRR
jgi:GTP pyrophosphokinase